MGGGRHATTGGVLAAAGCSLMPSSSHDWHAIGRASTGTTDAFGARSAPVLMTCESPPPAAAASTAFAPADAIASSAPAAVVAPSRSKPEIKRSWTGVGARPATPALLLVLPALPGLTVADGGLPDPGLPDPRLTTTLRTPGPACEGRGLRMLMPKPPWGRARPRKRCTAKGAGAGTAVGSQSPCSARVLDATKAPRAVTVTVSLWWCPRSRGALRCWPLMSDVPACPTPRAESDPCSDPAPGSAPKGPLL